MNIKTLLGDIKRLVGDLTGYQEHSPRLADNATQAADAPNTGIFRVVVLGTGQQKVAGMDRYADLAIVVANPISGGDANQTNEDGAVQAEELLTVIAAYDGEEAQTQETLEAAMIREHGRQVTTIQARVNYKYTEE